MNTRINKKIDDIDSNRVFENDSSNTTNVSDFEQ